MNYKVLITTSGIGSRLGELTKYTNKSLVRIGKKPAISYIIEAYPKDVPFVVTLGYVGNHVKDFLELAYPDRKIEFVTVKKYEGKGSSLGFSMLQAKKVLQCPFIYHACDTITHDTIPVPDHNWLAGFKGDDSTSYASLKVINDDTLIFNDKGAIDFDYLHIGLVGIHEYKKFWSELQALHKKRPHDSSLNDFHAIEKMTKKNSNFKLIPFTTWFDIGNTTSLTRTRDLMKDKFENLDKAEESIFLFDEYVIKFFHDKDIVKKRVARAEVLKGLVPEIEGVRDNFYRYSFVEGDLYSRVVTPVEFKEFLKWAKNELWVKNTTINEKDFKKRCKEFYHDKTLKRVEKFFSENKIKDSKTIINGEKIPDLKTIISKIDFDLLTNAEQYRIHGDFILENIIKTKDSYRLIDWRHEFAGLSEVGDIYYDLAKLNHNLTVNHDIVNANQFVINTEGNTINCDIFRRDILVNCQQELYSFLEENGFDVQRVKLLTALIWLNMSPLHHYPFNIFLFYFGKLNLWKALNENQK